MEYRAFGRTGLKVSPLALGCMMFGGKTNQDDTSKMIGRALDAGINVLDTANVYQGGRGEEFVEALWCAHANNLNRVACEQPPYYLLDRRIERELLPACRTFDTAVMSWSPIAGGLLTGKYRNRTGIPVGTRFADMGSNPIAASRWTDASLAQIERLLPLAVSKGVSLSHFSLAWVIQQPGVTSAINGPRTLEQLDDNLRVLSIRFTKEELQAIDEVVPPGSHTSPYYEGAFRPHARSGQPSGRSGTRPEGHLRDAGFA